MTKEQSLQLKGIAILMMLWLHLFIGDGSGIYYHITKACNPVCFFLLISGYGYSYKCSHGSLTLGGTAMKTLKLYGFYWLTMLIFVTIGHFIVPATYPGSATDMITNLIGVDCTYNVEAWFLFPYAMVTLLSVAFLPYMLAMKRLWHWLVAAVVFVAIFLFMRHVVMTSTDDTQFLFMTKLQILYFIQFFFYFTLGVLFYKLFNRRTYKKGSNMKYIILLVILFAFKACFKRTLADGLYAFAFVWLFIHLNVGRIASRVLNVLGKYSLGMWLTHTYYSKYLFADYVVWSDYHIVNFLTLIAISLATAYVIQKAYRFILKKIAL